MVFAAIFQGLQSANPRNQQCKWLLQLFLHTSDQTYVLLLSTYTKRACKQRSFVHVRKLPLPGSIRLHQRTMYSVGLWTQIPSWLCLRKVYRESSHSFLFAHYGCFTFHRKIVGEETHTSRFRFYGTPSVKMRSLCITCINSTLQSVL